MSFWLFSEWLSQQRHTARELIDLFLRTADGNAKILQSAFGNAAHLLNKFVIGLVVLGQIGEVYHRQILKIRLAEKTNGVGTEQPIPVPLWFTSPFAPLLEFD